MTLNEARSATLQASGHPLHLPDLWFGPMQGSRSGKAIWSGIRWQAVPKCQHGGPRTRYDCAVSVLVSVASVCWRPCLRHRWRTKPARLGTRIRSAIVVAAIGVECHGRTCSRTTPRRSGTHHRISPDDHQTLIGGFGA